MIEKKNKTTQVMTLIEKCDQILANISLAEGGPAVKSVLEN